MTASAAKQDWITSEEYLAGELLGDIRHEYACGRVYAMAGAGVTHNRIAGNLHTELSNHLRGKVCEAFINDMKIRMESGTDSYFYYPDVMVACDPSDNDEFFRRFPKVIVEVLSASTERIDSSEKLRAYLSIPSLEAYLLVSQKSPEVTLFRRVNQWRRETITGEGSRLEIQELDFAIDFARLYERTGLV